MIIVNKYQTQLTEESFESLHPYVKDELMDAINRIEFVQKLISPTRPKSHDLPRYKNPFARNLVEDPNGLIKPDYVNPHILVDMDYFRQAAIHFMEHNRYTFAHPSKHPNSEYQKFWKEEARRCVYGYIRESDGEWITGYNYYYWNYSPIMLAVAKETGEEIPDEITSYEGVAGDRVENFPNPWDMDYFYYHYLEEAEKTAKYGSVLKTRGRGYSFKGGSLLGRNYNFFKRSKSWAFASDKGDLIDDGLLTKAWDNLDFINEHTPWKKRRSEKNTMMHKRASYLDLDNQVYKGYKSEIIGLTTQNKPEKARGKRGKAILLEEAGRYLDLLKVWGIARPSMEQSSITFGLMIAFGTGGTQGAAFEGLETLFYQGGGYRVLMKQNVFDKTSGQGECAFYCGEYMNREFCYDKDGNSDVIKALIEVFYSRLEVLNSTTNPTAIVQEKADRSITPQEAVMRTEGTIFPIADLKDYIAEIRPNEQKFVSSHFIGRLSIASEEIKFIYDPHATPLRGFPANSKKDKSGSIEIYVHPRKLRGEVPNNRYIIGVDPYDDDTGTSLGSAFVFDMLTDRIVAEYTGRPKFANDFYEIVRRLALYYNAVINYENNNKGMFGYFNNKHCLYLLADNPKFLKDTDTTQARESYGNKAHPYSEKVYTPKGIKKWEDIKIGDYLFNSYGGITKVIDIPFDDITSVYEITLKDGRKVKASENHLWKVIDWNNNERVLSTKEIKLNYYRNKGIYKEYKYYIPKNEGCEYNYTQTPIDPYMLGLFLGDGCMVNSKYNQFDFCSNLKDLETYKNYIPFDIKTLDDRHHRININKIGKTLKDLNLHDKKSRTKFIPDIYKYNTKEVRLNILQGLMDTDGTVGYGGNPEYCTTSEFLKNDVIEIARSLGINCNSNKVINKFGNVYKVRFYTDVILFKLDRKLKKQKLTKTRSYKTAIVDIKYLNEEKSKCVTVDSKDSCYLINDFITTHNSKGTRANKEVNALGRRLQRDWMLSKAYNEDDLLNIHKIRSLAYIDELIAWNPDGNFDRVSAMGMVMIQREEMMKYVNKSDENKKANTLSNDKFWNNNY